ncbi:glycosyltransferase [Oribacterium sp. NK2B42]|uniref:glycosyltransferase n=1 Tax=Oribacterium sp. NK2B42 TaxID=689781 RepID=UPI0003FAEE5B|nr:glycosyltransferase [Oribacterium sp. NK2B42]
MRISIITVCLNSVNTIEKTINSVICQGIEDLEYIIIDGGSKDGTVDVIKKYEDFITYWVSEKDYGIYNAMNKGLKQATGEVIGLLNSDDWYNYKTLKEVERIFDKNKDIGVIFGNIILVDKEGNHIVNKYPSFNTLWYQMSIGHPATFVKKNVYDEYGLFDEKFKIAADYELIYRLWKSKVKFLHYDSVFTYFRTSGISSTSISLCQNETYEICKKNINDFLMKKSLELNNLQSDKPIYIWGIGNKGKFFLGLLYSSGIKVTGIFDNDKDKEGTKYGEIIVQRFVTFYANNDIQIIVTIKDGYEDVRKEIESSCKSLRYKLFYYEDILKSYEEMIESNNGCLTEIDDV